MNRTRRTEARNEAPRHARQGVSISQDAFEYGPFDAAPETLSNRQLAALGVLIIFVALAMIACAVYFHEQQSRQWIEAPAVAVRS